MLPAFIETDGTIMFVNPPEASDAGNYNYKICSEIANSLQTSACTDFNMIVEATTQANITVSIKPEWLISLED